MKLLGKIFSLNPIARKRLRRFRQMRRAWLSLWLLLILYGVSLCAELVANDVPLLVSHGGRWYFPVFWHYSSDELTGDGSGLAPDYHELERSERFVTAGSWMIWPWFRSGPNSQVRSEELEAYRRVEVRLTPVPGVATLGVSAELALVSAEGLETLCALPEGGMTGRSLAELWDVPGAFRDALARRFANEACEESEHVAQGKAEGIPAVTLRLLAFRPRRRAPKRILLKVLEADGALRSQVLSWRFERGAEQRPAAGSLAAWETLSEELRRQLVANVKAEFAKGQASTVSSESVRVYGGEAQATGEAASGETVALGGRPHRLTCELEAIVHPFRPVPGHRLGLDDAGRDVLARILYGLRTSLTFGLVLVVSSMLFGTFFGCLQGYMGGCVDLLGQRAIEIWSALPFLYIVILLGSLFGTGFCLLLVCYALFNWIGVSYYMRAEMLRLRRQPFVEAARCLGLPWWLIVGRHILPNALVPLVTFVPFSLVGAIGSLAGLDYLGFGLPPPTPSLGQLLQQAQVQREAWWLIAYPSLALFVVMLLCVFIGEGVREAFDPRRQNRIH